jgi:DNA segregation ATPase FtsK/SpoIIIE, S-DNA-T family
MAKILLTPEDRAVVTRVLREGLGQRDDPQWRAARIALARSLQIATSPGDEFSRPIQQKGGSELHDAQVTGHGSAANEDYRDVFAALLSVHDNRNYFTDPETLDDALNRHIRRGIKEIQTSLRDNFDFYDYLLQELYFERTGDRGSSAQAEGSRLEERLARILGQLGIGADIVGHDDGPRLTRFTIELHGLDDLDRMRKGVGKVAFALGLGEDTVSCALAPGERRVVVDIPRPMGTWSTITWSEVRSALGSDEAGRMALPICVGTDVLGKPLLLDLAEAPHLFIGGTTGSGKSMCLHALLLSLIHRSDLQPELVLIDPKAVEFSGYQGCSAVRTGAPITDVDGAAFVLNQLVSEMEERQERLRALDARNITEANERRANLKRIVLCIDELGDLFVTNREVEGPLIRLAQRARFVGIHLVLATQRPEAATFPGLLRSNVPSRIALTVQKSAESRIILDEVGAEALLMRGDMLVRFAGRPTFRAHGCLVEPSDIVEAVRAR